MATGDLDPEMALAIASDAEGNQIKDYEGWSTMIYSEEVDEDTWYGEEDLDSFSEEEQASFKPYLVLFPY